MNNHRQQHVRRILDASGDHTPARVAEDGALQINLASPNQTEALTASVTARDLTTGETFQLGTHTIGANRQSFYINLKDKLIANNGKSINGDYSIDVSIFSSEDKANKIIEQFDETITFANTISPEDSKTGDASNNTFRHKSNPNSNDIHLYFGRGGTDSLDLTEFNSEDVHFFNGKDDLLQANASELGQQTFYAGTVFDSMTLANGDEIYMQGIEQLHFGDVTINLSPDLDRTSRTQWNTQVMDVNGAWRFNTGSDNVVLVSLDTGFAPNDIGQPEIHNDLKHVKVMNGLNTYRNFYKSHGHEAMSVMGAAHDGSDVAGIAPNAQLWGYNLYGNGMTLYEAIQHAKDNRQPNERLIFQGGIQGDFWWNSGSSRNEMERLLATTEENCFFSIAAGNYHNRQSVSGVAKASKQFSNIAAVGALQYTSSNTDVDGIINANNTTTANYSNRGDGLTLMAPTDSPAIVDADGVITDFSGTSCANPNLAGVAALVWGENENLDGSDVREILTTSATDLGAGGYDGTFGHGLVNAEAAVRRAHALAQNNELASFWNHQDVLA